MKLVKVVEALRCGHRSIRFCSEVLEKAYNQQWTFTAKIMISKL